MDTEYRPSQAQAMRAASRFSYTTSGGTAYQLQRATALSLLTAGLPPEFFTQFVVDRQATGDAAQQAQDEVRRVTEDPALLATLLGFMGAVLAAHLVAPKLFNGHPADCPPDAITLGDLPENDPLELFQALTASVMGDRGRAAMRAAAAFREGTGGAAVPGDMPQVPIESGPGAAGK